jgi:hypothetical protein
LTQSRRATVVVAFLFAVLIHTPRAATAGPVLQASIGQDVSALVLAPSGVMFGFRLSQLGGFVDGWGEVRSGPLSSVVLEPSGGPVPNSIYVFARGNILIDLDWHDSDGVFQTGQFRASIPDFRIRVLLEDDSEGCCSPRTERDYLQLGAGSFDSNVAAALGVARQTVGGEIGIWWEEFTGEAGSTERLAEGNNVDAFLIAVPEPSLVSILGLAGVGMMARRNQRRRA